MHCSQPVFRFQISTKTPKNPLSIRWRICTLTSIRAQGKKHHYLQTMCTKSSKTTLNSSTPQSSTTVTLVMTILVLKPSSVRICSNSMARLSNVRNICWCVFLLGSTSTTSMQRSRLITWCRKNILPTPPRPSSIRERPNHKCHLAFCSLWKTIASTGSMIPSSKRQKYPNRQVGLDCQFTIFAPLAPISQGPMALQTGSFPCSVCLTIPLAMSTKVAEKEKGLLPFM